MPIGSLDTGSRAPSLQSNNERTHWSILLREWGARKEMPKQGSISRIDRKPRGKRRLYLPISGFHLEAAEPQRLAWRTLVKGAVPVRSAARQQHRSQGVRLSSVHVHELFERFFASRIPCQRQQCNERVVDVAGDEDGQLPEDPYRQAPSGERNVEVGLLFVRHSGPTCQRPVPAYTETSGASPQLLQYEWTPPR